MTYIQTCRLQLYLKLTLREINILLPLRRCREKIEIKSSENQILLWQKFIKYFTYKKIIDMQLLKV